MEKFIEKFRLEELSIINVGSWCVSLRPQQPTIGSMILSLRRPCKTMGELSPKEGMELTDAIQRIEKIFSDSFKPDKINYLALMMVDEHVHFHVIPRYSTSCEFLGKNFEDTDWPYPPQLSNAIDLEETELKELLEYLKEKTN